MQEQHWQPHHSSTSDSSSNAKDSLTNTAGLLVQVLYNPGPGKP